jgi:RNA polymerase sigma-70 factor (ECF subfamily)
MTLMVDRTNDVRELVEHLFRHHAGQMLATLGRILGPEHIDLAEEAVQDAMVQALRQWPFRGIPDNPGGWLAHVAGNRALDVLRRRSAFRRKLPEIEQQLRTVVAGKQDETPPNDTVADDQLAMMFACCHPAIPPDAQVALTLNIVGGFSAAEVARAFLASESTVAQRLVRSKRRIRDEPIPLSIPLEDELPRRLDSVLRVIYLLFNEGYTAHQGEELVRFDLCNEAIRLGGLLLRRPSTSLPKVHALLSLMLLQGSRLAARQSSEGDLLLLLEQDRSLWDQQALTLGIRHLDQACAGDELTEYHIQAAIAAKHAVAPSYDDTDWPGMLALYDQLMEVAPSPVVALNRAVAEAMVHGPEIGLKAVDAIAWDESLTHYYLFAATRADFLLQLGRRAEAARHYCEAMEFPCTAPERRFLLKRLSQCEHAAPSANGSHKN